MTVLPVTRVSTNDDRSLPVFEQAAKLLEQIRARAFRLSAERGFAGDRALDDWLIAESEICWPATKLVEYGDRYEIEVALPGYEPDNVEVTVTPREVIVHANVQRKASKEKDKVITMWSDFGSDDVYRRIEVSTDLDVGSVSAALQEGLLKVIAPKKAVVMRKVPVSTAA